MNSNLVRIVIWGSVAVAVAVVFYIRHTTSKVSGFVDEANALVEAGEAKRKELGSEGNQLLSGVIPRGFFAERVETKTSDEDVFVNAPKELALDRAKLEKSVAKTDDVLAKVVEDYRAAAAKFDEGRKLSLNGAVSKYFELMSQAYQNQADAEEARRKAVALLLDTSLTSEGELHKKQNAFFKGASDSENEFERLQAEAQKLHDDNKSKFK